MYVYIAGNTPAHLVLLEGVEISAADCLYISRLEGMVDTSLLETIASLNISQVEQTQLCVLVFLFRCGARDSLNYYGQGVADLIEQGDMRKVFQEVVSRGHEMARGWGEGQEQEHQYEEIADSAETVEEASLLDKREEGVAAATTPAEAAVITPAGAIATTPAEAAVIKPAGAIVTTPSGAIVTAPEGATVTTPSGATMTTPAAAPSECRICSEVLPLAIFLPCNHQVRYVTLLTYLNNDKIKMIFSDKTETQKLRNVNQLKQE